MMLDLKNICTTMDDKINSFNAKDKKFANVLDPVDDGDAVNILMRY